MNTFRKINGRRSRAGSASCLRGERGQFVPISLMIMFTIVVVLLAVVNIYTISRAKLKVQNLADAAALNLASQEASAINAITDRNEWMNHLYANSPAISPGQPCPPIDKSKQLPGISCAEYASYTQGPGMPKGFSFFSKDGATGYGRLVQSINDAQNIFANTYNTFIGAGNQVGQKAMESILTDNIPDLKNDPTIHLVTWNDASEGQNAATDANNIATSPPGASVQSLVKAHMKPLAFSAHDMTVAYDKKTLLGKQIYAGSQAQSLGQLIGSADHVGWMELDAQNMPRLQVKGPGGQPRPRMGVGVYVVKTVSILGRTVPVMAHAIAYVVPASGSLPLSSDSQQGPLPGPPIFLPTFYVKLGNS